ncbi:MAG: hypothetical protein HeimC3_21600 [Candidatus Heimdallarchaeota archaeon LC_3]|nr:MAG: hypothetical protein HeimC3_21600 [Candidatus Heimdallarchaeota archaeon LC_3]
MISKVQTRDKKTIKRPSNSSSYTKVAILSIIVLSSGFFILNSLNTSSNPAIIPPGKVLPNNMIEKSDPKILSSEYVDSAYNYVKSNSNLLEQLKCYCGCDNIHDNNRQCFWKDNGTIDTHAQSCGVCIHIALAAKQLNEADWTTTEIRQYIDSLYR